MDERVDQVAALANLAHYDSKIAAKYIDGAPHIKHSSLKSVYRQLMIKAYDFAKRHTGIPNVLDLGAGEGSVTLAFLELGSNVTAVDISKSQLDVLQSKCVPFANKLDVRCEDVNQAIKSKIKKYDIIVANSLLHHIPDYLTLIKEAVSILTPHGQFISFQDPLRYDSLGKFTLIFSKLAYFSFRVFKGDLVQGFKRYMRRKKGIYLVDSIEDNIEYHIIRNGVDQYAIYLLLNDLGLDCDIVSYFSTQSRIFHLIGTMLGIKNTFSIIATNRSYLKSITTPKKN